MEAVAIQKVVFVGRHFVQQPHVSGPRSQRSSLIPARAPQHQLFATAGGPNRGYLGDTGLISTARRQDRRRRQNHRVLALLNAEESSSPPAVEESSSPPAVIESSGEPDIVRLSEGIDATAATGHRRRVALFVEPSPFAYVCGYKNRFQNLIRYLREAGDEVLVVTTHHGAPTEFLGARVVPSLSFPCPWYPILPLSLALSPRIFNYVKNFRPDVIHASSPGIMVFGALVFAKLLSRPLVLSYHTHVPKYIPQYTFSFMVEPMWAIIRFLHRAADLTLVTSEILGEELKGAGAAAANRISVWRKGVDSQLFHPSFKSEEMRYKLSGGEPEKPLIVHVGRLGAEKNLSFLKLVLERCPGARLAFVGDGPYRPTLEEMFKGTPTVFMGMMTGEALSAAYASGDVFITPSETETLGFVVLEAMASGTPVVAARAGGIRNIVDQEGVTGFLYTPGDLEDCMDKVQRLLSDPELRQTIAEAGRKDVERYDWRASTRQIREEQYTAAIKFWRRRRDQLRRLQLRWLPWWMKKTEWQL